MKSSSSEAQCMSEKESSIQVVQRRGEGNRRLSKWRTLKGRARVPFQWNADKKGTELLQAGWNGWRKASTQDRSKSNDWLRESDTDATAAARIELLAWEGPQLTEAWREAWRRSRAEIHGCSDEAAESVDVSGEDSNPASVWADDRPGRFERAAGGAEAGRCGA